MAPVQSRLVLAVSIPAAALAIFLSLFWLRRASKGHPPSPPDIPDKQPAAELTDKSERSSSASVSLDSDTSQRFADESGSESVDKTSSCDSAFAELSLKNSSSTDTLSSHGINKDEVCQSVPPVEEINQSFRIERCEATPEAFCLLEPEKTEPVDSQPTEAVVECTRADDKFILGQKISKVDTTDTVSLVITENIEETVIAVQIKENQSAPPEPSVVPVIESVSEIKTINSDDKQSSASKMITEETSSPIKLGYEKESDIVKSDLSEKLANLELDTMKMGDVDVKERDSANHSPSEIMLASPSMSNFSDAHSEGSSDSGKGHSDGTTSPSRTPAGGSSVSGDPSPSIYEFVIPQVIVGRLIGRHGVFLHEIMSVTHTNIFIKVHPDTVKLKICAIEGSQQDIEKALEMIRKKFPSRRYPKLTLERVSFVQLQHSQQLRSEDFHLQLIEGVNNDVILSSLLSPGQFFVQQPCHPSYPCLTPLTQTLTQAYSTTDPPALVNPVPDAICVCPSLGGWYRAQIVGVDDDARHCDIKFVDYRGESVAITKVFGTNKGRIFLGGADGCLYEIVYQKELGWWGKRCKKVNHSKGLLSFLVPSFVNSALYEEDAIIDMQLDKSRNILYTLTEKGTVEVFDLGHDGWGMYRVASLTQSAIMYATNNILRIENIEGNVEVGRIVAICPFEDHTSIGLVGLTQYGIRYYLSTCNSPRPTNLHLSHVRLPPGYTPISSQSMRGSTIIQSVSLSGSFVISTTTIEGTHDKLWCLSGDMFAMKSWFSENVTEISLSGKPVALAEISVQNSTEGKSIPMMICQHNHVPDRIAVLTIQGTDIFEKLRPVDVLAEVLKRRLGPDSEQVKNLFTIVGHDDACAMCVMLACDHWTTNNQVAEWATRAFILYGGEAKPVSQPIHLSQQPVGAPLQYSQLQQQPPTSQQSIYPLSTGHVSYPTSPTNLTNLPSCFRPRDVSTPLGNKPVSMVETQVVETSHKHNGLYIYLSRILRNIWRKKIVNKVKMADSNQYLVSSLFESDIARVTSHLYALKLFLQKNTQLPPANVVPGVDMAPPTLGTPQAAPVGSPLSARTRLHEAQIQERNSLDSLKHLVEHALQVLGLWKLLAEHQFHIIVMSLPPELQNQMPELTFRDLIFAGKDLCHALINSLINMYLNDNTSVDSISNKLREVCPSLFKTEDAACSKANEVLLAVKDELDPEERQAKLRTALKLCKEVAGELDVSSVCAQLIQCKYYEGVIELCVERANKLDPNSLAQHHLSKNHPQEDLQGAQAYLNRMRTYQEISVMLDHLYQQCHPSSKSPTQLLNGHTASQPHALLESVVVDSLEVGDEVCHSVVYDWLVSRGLTSSLVRLGRPSLERYLTRHPRKLHLPFRDLLWQYYETSGNHSAAAQILYNLAIQPCEGIKFDQRFNYLGKAVMCMRSDGCGQHMGIFLHELEDTLHVARVQRQIMDNLTSISIRENRVEEAIQKLNSGLLNITQLYENFAVPFDLWECQLTVLECAGYDDKDLIQRTWDKIISQELSRGSSSSPDDQMALVMNKLKTLGLQFSVQSPCFPLAYLVRQLEILSCKLNVNKAHVHSTMTSIGVPVQVLLEIYDRLYTLNDRCWMVEGNEFHLIQVIASFADAFTNNLRIVPAEERTSVGLQFQDLIVNCLNTLYCKQDVTQLINYLKTIQSNLERV